MGYALDVEGIKHYPAETVRAQIAACLSSWGMPPDHVEITARAMVDADECGNDTHGIALLTSYDQWRREGRLTMDPQIEMVHRTPVSAVIDAGGSLGYVPGVTACEFAIAQSKEVGMAAVAVRNSAHFGAAGYYTRMIAAEGLVGLCTTNGSAPRSAPTYGREAKLSTNPVAFAAPAARHPAFSLDMATTTVAGGKIRIRANERMEMPAGWANDPQGRPLTDAHSYWYGEGGTLAPLGATPEGASYKGYGLGAMVEILSVGLSGASLVTSPNHGRRTPGSFEIGHFFLALDPAAFGQQGALTRTVDQLIDDLHATEPLDPAQPVMVAGEPETRARAERKTTGIPIPPGLRQRIRELAESSNADFMLH